MLCVSNSPGLCFGVKWDDNMPEEWNQGLAESREIGWSVPHSRNCSCRTPLDTRTALCINLTHVRWQEFQQGATGLIGNPAVLVQLICIKVQYITTSHYMNSYLMGFTQFMLLNLRTNGMSQQISASNDAENLRQDRKSRCNFCASSHAASRNQIIPSHIHKSYYLFFSFWHQCSCSILSKGKAFSQSQSQHSCLQLLLFYNHTITIFMRTPADGKTISLCPLPISSFLCGPYSFLWAYFNEKCDAESLRQSVVLQSPQLSQVNEYELMVLKTLTASRLKTLAKHRRIKDNIPLPLWPHIVPRSLNQQII